MAVLHERGLHLEPIQPRSSYTLGVDLWLVITPIVLALALAGVLVAIS